MISLVTGNTATAEMLPRLISAKGYQISVFDCGDDVVNRSRFRKPDLIIVDCGISDSFKLVGSVRRDIYSRTIPVVMFTDGDEDLREQAILHGADAYIPKGSLDWAELLEEMRRFAGPPNTPDDSAST